MRVEYRVYRGDTYPLEGWLNAQAEQGFRLHSFTPRENWGDQIIAVVVRQVQGDPQ